jgi:hypothetical protein
VVAAHHRDSVKMDVQMASATQIWPGIETEPAFSVLVRKLSHVLGRKLIAYIGGLQNVSYVDDWISGSASPGPQEARIRLAWQIAETLQKADHPKVVQAWFLGMNPDLEDSSAIQILQEQDPREAERRLAPAVRSFVALG